jgi:hypothetical protein
MDKTNAPSSAALVPGADDFARSIKDAVAAVAEHNAALGKSAERFAQEWMHVAGENFERNLRLFTELSQARSLPDLAEVQARILREMTEFMQANAKRMTEAALHAMQQAGTHVSDSASVAARALRSGLAHKGEPPDYAADNE